MQTLKKFLNNRPALKLTVLEREANLPQRTLKFVNNGQRELPQKHWRQLKKVLVKYGWKD